ncbi:MAG: hypothetical protein HEP70_12115 [Rhodobiaceae bacterium]|nr:hypothetical protein [Rhodobiaceae bacterium]
MRGFWVVLGTVLSVGMLSACTSAPPAPPTEISITFQHRVPIALNVAKIELVDRYQPTLRSPHVEHLHKVTPSTVIRAWVDERLRAAGTRGLITLIVEEAGVVEEPVSVSDGFGGLFRDEVDTRLVGVIRARFEHIDVGPPGASHSVEVIAEASAEVLESATLNERDLAYFRLVERLVGEFDRVLTAEIEKSLTPLIIR